VNRIKKMEKDLVLKKAKQEKKAAHAAKGEACSRKRPAPRVSSVVRRKEARIAMSCLELERLLNRTSGTASQKRAHHHLADEIKQESMPFLVKRENKQLAVAGPSTSASCHTTGEVVDSKACLPTKSEVKGNCTFTENSNAEVSDACPPPSSPRSVLHVLGKAHGKAHERTRDNFVANVASQDCIVQFSLFLPEGLPVVPMRGQDLSAMWNQDST